MVGAGAVFSRRGRRGSEGELLRQLMNRSDDFERPTLTRGDKIDGSPTNDTIITLKHQNTILFLLLKHQT